MTTPCDGNCACETACPSCPSAASSCLPPFAAPLPFVAPLRADVEAWGEEWLANRVAQHKVRVRFPRVLGADTSATITDAGPCRAGAEGPATGSATLSTPARKEGER
jgi:hypothetical protein